MSLTTELFLAWRYLRPKRNAVSVITCISVLGVMLGVAVLIVVIAVMTGFTDEFKSKLLETTAHLQVFDMTRGYIDRPETVKAAAAAIGAQAAPVVQQSALLQHEGRFVPKTVIGIYPDQDTAGIDVSGAVRYGSFSLESGEVMISDLVAAEMGIGIGDKLIIHAPAKLAKMVNVNRDGRVEFSEFSRVYLPGEYKVSGIFSFGKYDFDRGVVFLNLDDADDLFGLPLGAANAVYVRIDNPFHPGPAQRALQQKLPGLQIYTWQELNSKFLGVLAVEKNMQFFLLIFIVLVAAFSIANTLITVVVQKTREIGLLKALGAGGGTVMRIFLLQGFMVGLLGTGCGISLGLLVIRYRNAILGFLRWVTGQEVFPAEFYLFSQLPASIHGFDILWIGLVSMALCTCGGLLPAWRAA
ncbi:MAG: ABC transporter permease, partial [Rhodospirillales bacterium]|nr:ABC transporter permease [Rhodospirillales bacterium]